MNKNLHLTLSFAVNDNNAIPILDRMKNNTLGDIVDNLPRYD